MTATVQSLTEEQLLLFLAQLFVLLGVARGLGLAARRLGQPSLVGELLAGVLLGPTILGRLAPSVQVALFPSDAVQNAMIGTVAWAGLLLLLLSAGLEVNVSVVWRQRGDALKISLSDIVLPMVVAFVPAYFLPDRYLPDPSQRLIFALFIAAVMTISALPMTLRALHDLDLLKSDLGLLIVSALTINDIVGWALFTLVLGFAGHAEMGAGQVALVLAGTVVFTAVCMTVGRRIVGAGIQAVQRRGARDAGLVLTFVCCVGLLAGLGTHAMGIHALFGFFLAGIMAGDSPALSERTRHVIHEMVYAVFVPVFFAGIALQIDFLANFDLLLVVLFTALGIAGRYSGAWVGARMTAMSKWDRVTTAIAHTPGGSMEMVMAYVALEFRLITVPVFVAIIFAALLSSLLLGPWMAWSIRRRRRLNLLDIVVRNALPVDLPDADRWVAIRVLCEAAGEEPRTPHAANLEAAALAREKTAGTALGNGLAAPHARVVGLDRALVTVGRSMVGIEWDSPDGQPVHLVFLVLTPAEQADLHVQVLAALARGLSDADTRRRLLQAQTGRDAQAVLRDALRRQDLVRTTS